MNEEASKTKRKRLKGVVVSDKMEKTAVVLVADFRKDPKYGKFVKSRKKYKVHDPENRLKEGDETEIEESRPLSKDKRWSAVYSEGGSPGEGKVNENNQ